MYDLTALTALFKLRACGFDPALLSRDARATLQSWLDGTIPVELFLQAFPIPHSGAPLDSALCIVNAFAPLV